jgi:hypothetical protein
MLRLALLSLFLLVQGIGPLSRAEACVTQLGTGTDVDLLFIDISDDFAYGFGEKSEKQVVSRSKRVEFRSKLKCAVDFPVVAKRPVVVLSEGAAIGTRHCLRYPVVVSLCNLRL